LLRVLFGARRALMSAFGKLASPAVADEREYQAKRRSLLA
jgi:hypothetical protein